MDNKEKVERCKNVKIDGYDRCKVYSRWIGHNVSEGYNGCADCSFATLSRVNDKPIWRV